jgi:hypothetical protein
MGGDIDLCSVSAISLGPRPEKTFRSYQRMIENLREDPTQSKELEIKREEVREFLDKNRKFHITV